MESAWMAAALMHPVGLLVLFVAVISSSYILLSLRDPPLRRRQLVGGYVGLVAFALGMAAAGSYVSPEDAVQIWKVPPEAYWSALLDGFFTSAVLAVYIGLMGSSVVGVPVIFWLARRGLKGAPWVLGASVVISTIAAALLAQTSTHPFETFLRDTPYLAGAHLLLALGFCIGARLPWVARTLREAA
jgi:hypothetical protein